MLFLIIEDSQNFIHPLKAKLAHTMFCRMVSQNLHK